jgi:SAM-dependent methyltransferase
MGSELSSFWDERFKHEGLIWGEEPSSTVQLALHHIPAHARLLEVGFGYGRDLLHTVRQGYRVWGVDFSAEARRITETRLQREGLQAERLLTGSFDSVDCPDGFFDAVVSHRVAHLLTTEEAVERFAEKVWRLLRPGGILALGVRNTEDQKASEIRRVGENLYEYTPRPGHWIRFWDDESLRKAFGKGFTLLALDRACEDESLTIAVPCHLTVLIGQKIDKRDLNRRYTAT